MFEFCSAMMNKPAQRVCEPAKIETPYYFFRQAYNKKLIKPIACLVRARLAGGSFHRLRDSRRGLNVEREDVLQRDWAGKVVAYNVSVFRAKRNSDSVGG